MLLQPARTKKKKRPPSRARGVLLKTLGVVVIIGLLGLGTRGCVDWSVARSIDSRTVGVGKTTVASGDVPMIFHYWIMGGLKNGSVTLHDISAAPVNISSLQVTADRLRFARGSLLSGKARLTGTPPYRISVYLSPDDLGDYLTATVHFQRQYLVATIDGHNLFVVPELRGRTIVLSDGKHTYTVPLPGTAYLPCKPTSLAVGNGVQVSCVSRTLPKILAHATK